MDLKHGGYRTDGWAGTRADYFYKKIPEINRFLHNKGANFLWLDGRANFITYLEFISKGNNTDTRSYYYFGPTREVYPKALQ